MKKDYEKEIHKLFEGWDSAFNDNSQILESNNVKRANKSMKKKLNEAEDDYVKIGNKIYPKDASGFGYDSADSISSRTARKYNQEKEDERKEQERIQKEKDNKEFADAHKGIGQELLNKINIDNTADALDTLFDEIVPNSGKADSVAGEIVRAIERILYRDYNDGDRFYIGYGVETCGSSAQYLMENTTSEISSMIYDVAENPDMPDSAYTEKITDIGYKILLYLQDNPELFETMNIIDSRNYDDSDIKELEPKFEYELNYPDEVLDSLNYDKLDSSDLRYEIELAINDFCSNPNINYYSEYAVIDNLTYDEYEELESGRYTDDFWDSIIEEYGLHEEYEDEDEEDFNESYDKYTFKNEGHDWEILDQKGSYSLIHSTTKKHQPYAVVYCLDSDGTWGQGHYFDDAKSAEAFFKKATKGVKESKFNHKRCIKMNEMYRDYENPRKLERMLRDLERERKELVREGASEDELMDIDIDIETLKERINFAWQDEEYDKTYESMERSNKKHSLKESANEDDVIWSSDVYEYADNFSKEDLIADIIDNGYWEDIPDIDAETETTEGVEEVLSKLDVEDLYELYDPDYELASENLYDNLMNNVYPMIEKQCEVGYLFLNGQGANWKGSFDASLIKNIENEDEFKDLFYPDYDATTELIDNDGTLYFRESSHDVPMGWGMPLYSFKDEESYESAIDYMNEELNKELDPEDRYEPDYDDADGYFDELTNGDVKTFIERGWLTPVRVDW